MSTSLDYSAERQHWDHHLRLLRDFIRQVQQQPPFVLEECPEEDLEFLRQLEALPRAHEDDDFLHRGQHLLSRVIAAYAHLVPLLHRDLLWYFGGDCLHYMPDEEIAQYQELDERFHEAITEGREFSYENERAKIFGLH